MTARDLTADFLESDSDVMLRADRAGSRGLHFVFAIIALCVRRGLLGRVLRIATSVCVVHQRLLRRFDLFVFVPRTRQLRK